MSRVRAGRGRGERMCLLQETFTSVASYVCSPRANSLDILSLRVIRFDSVSF